jgi:hypothetical protein
LAFFSLLLIKKPIFVVGFLILFFSRGGIKNNYMFPVDEITITQLSILIYKLREKTSRFVSGIYYTGQKNGEALSISDFKFFYYNLNDLDTQSGYYDENRLFRTQEDLVQALISEFLAEVKKKIN